MECGRGFEGWDSKFQGRVIEDSAGAVMEISLFAFAVYGIII